ncbi:hypothetical protein C2G38_2238170 [Gigaspora rosea]|uniref:Uncharacterized protein n=1 Tax=Gigaspora rosea TaxID=44941 RepID=A0A397WCB4_9GLOM|nr:hypothetical protein C2G38_2238170 [Gigaspora rosea]
MAANVLNALLKDEGKNYYQGEEIKISFCHDKNITHIDRIVHCSDLRGFNCFYEFQSYIQLKPKKCESFTYTLPDNLTADAEYSIAIYYDGFGVESGTFSINQPNSGLIITDKKWVKLQRYECGQNITVTWKDPKQKYQDVTTDFIVLKDVYNNDYDYLAYNVSISAGKEIVTIPSDLINSQGVGIAIVLLRNNFPEEYMSDTFTVIGCPN